MLGFIDSAIAGGMENMDLAPYLLREARWGHRMAAGVLVDSMLDDGLNDAFSGQHSGWHTEDLAAKYQISRSAQDRWVERSQFRFAAAQAAGKFVAEIAPIELPGRKGPTCFGQDEHNRPGTTAELLAALKAAFRKDGTITAGNAPGLNGGAAIVLAVIHDLGLPKDVVNVEGGAIAHGHPIGVTGAVLTTRLLRAMQRDGLRRGIVTLCIGGGQGIALALERRA